MVPVMSVIEAEVPLYVCVCSYMCVFVVFVCACAYVNMCACTCVQACVACVRTCMCASVCGVGGRVHDPVYFRLYSNVTHNLTS